uniref:Uncharacterized protein n=1 Tax=Kalanchoe fedtschenkoi TaxID=63787 RepID=A0A7N0UWC6_KALFE
MYLSKYTNQRCSTMSKKLSRHKSVTIILVWIVVVQGRQSSYHSRQPRNSFSALQMSNSSFGPSFLVVLLGLCIGVFFSLFHLVASFKGEM